MEVLLVKGQVELLCSPGTRKSHILTGLYVHAVSVVQSSFLMNPHWKAVCGGQGCMNTVLTLSACVANNNQSRAFGYLS